MDYYKKDERREHRQRRVKTGRPMILVAAALIGVLVIVGVGLLVAFYGEIFSVKGIKGFVRVNLLGKTPAFHYLVIERNGSDERIEAGNALTVTYRDEFIIKKVSTDSLFEKNVTVDVDGLGGANDLKILLKAVELVDGAMAASVREALRGKPLPPSGIRIRYGEQEIGAVPVRIELTPQDWLRFARNPANAKWQAQALEKALGMNPDDTALRKTLAEQYLEAGKVDLAIAQYRAVLARKSDDMTALSGLSRCYVEKKDYAKALPLTRRITELNPKDAGAHAIAGFLYGKMGKWGEAVDKSIESLLERASDYGNTTFELVKLKALDKTSEVVSSFIPHAVVMVLVGIFMLFLNLGLAFWLGKILSNIYLGFFALAAFYGIIGIVMHFFMHKWLKKLICNFIIKKVAN